MVGVGGLGLRVCVALAGCGIGLGDFPALGLGWAGREGWVVGAGEALLWLFGELMFTRRSCISCCG
jgi:hypothetical protein